MSTAPTALTTVPHDQSFSTASDAAKKQPLEVSAVMKEMWEDAAKAFESICGQSLQKGEVKNFDELQKKIESSSDLKATDEEKEDTQEKSKKLGLKLLKYLKVLVGVATEASSLVPFPGSAANAVSGALSFVLDTPKTIKGYKDGIDQVFSDVSSALAQFHIYGSMEKLHSPPLIHQIHLVMVSFIKVCAHVVKYRQGSRADRLHQQFKFVLRDDSGLGKEMENFRHALQQQRDLEGTVMLSVVVDTQAGMVQTLEKLVVIGKTTEDTHQRVRAFTDKADRTETLNKIRNALSLPETLSLDANTTSMCTAVSEKCLDNTGTWIWSNSAYTAWTAPKDTRGPHVLFLTGPPSSGKSSATALITKRLEEQQKSRTYVAHYFFGASSKKTDEKNPVPLALNHLAFQLARVDPIVRKTLSKACDAPLRRLEGLDMLWSILWSESKTGTTGSGSTYYLVFDGLENLTYDQAKTLLTCPTLTSESAGRVRVLASWTDEWFSKYMNSIPSFHQIRIVEHNGQDMRLIIEKALSNRSLLQSVKPDSIQQRARDKILDKLPQSVGGSYSLLQFGLDEVVHVLSMRSSSEALDRVLDQSISSHQVAVKNLQRSLAEDDIKELNELLKWVIYCYEWMTLDQLEAAMFLYSGTESLVSLQYIIEQKYSAVLKVENNFAYDQDGFKEYLEKGKIPASHASNSKDSPTISMTITIKNVEQELCGHFLWDLAHKAIREKFSFDFATASSNTLSIAIDEFEAHHTIVKRAFEYLAKDPEEQTDPIGRYLVIWLPNHLARLHDLEDEEVGALNPNEQFEIGKNLWQLFKDEQIFQRHRKTFEQLCWTADQMDSVKRWLMDSAIVRRLDRTWREEVQHAASPTRGFMRSLVGMVVRGFLRERSWQVKNAYAWIDEFMSVDQKFHQPVAPARADKAETSASSGSPANWDHVSAWCQAFLGLSDSELDSLWYERLAEASSLQEQQGNNADTVSLYQRAIEKENPSWLCHRGLGRTHFDGGRIADAIAEVELALEEVAREGATPKPDAKNIVELRLLLGQYNYEAGNAEKAAEHYELARDSEDTEQARQGQLGYFKANLSLLDAAGTMQLLKGLLADDGGEAQMASVLKLIARDAEHDMLVSKVFTAAKADPDVMKGIVRAMETATRPNATETVGDDPFAEAEARGVLLYDRGVAAYRYNISSDAPEPVGAALRLWKESYELLDNGGGRNASMAREAAIWALALHNFQSARESHPGGDVHIDALAQLAKDDSKGYVSDLYPFLGALRACRGEKLEAHTALARHVRFGLQILSDDIAENDGLGFFIIWKALLNYGDLKNAVFALALTGQPDLLTEALFILKETMKKDSSTKRYLDTVNKLAEETVKVAKTKVPDAAQQLRRIEVAKEHIECLMTVADEGETETEPDNGDDDGKVKESEKGKIGDSEAMESAEGIDYDAEGSDYDSAVKGSDKQDRETAIHALHDRICVLQQRHTPQIDKSDWAIVWSCDGLMPDGKKCENVADFTGVLYHCVYCWNRDFCWDCLERLRKPNSGADITVCSASHRWIRMPQQGGDMYAGQYGKCARMPREVRPVEGDDQILEIVYDEDGGEVVTLEAWKETLTREWGEERGEEGKSAGS
ncbi:hypothetical protein DFH06DRAFT_1291418 [Mycena polygramma]|nr:hypothetical protein DFH06DRAFT_1291418 [Mycena polygramma]